MTPLLELPQGDCSACEFFPAIYECASCHRYVCNNCRKTHICKVKR